MTDVGQLLGRGVAFPPRIGADGRWGFSTGAENIRESIRLILLTEPRERKMLPQFGGGLKRYLFRPNTVATRRLVQETIIQALGRWEPRIDVEAVEVEADPDDPRAATATIQYKLVATQASDQIRLSVFFST